MVNSYSSQINILNRFNHDEGLNGLCKSQVKLDEGSLSTTAQDRLEKISLQTSFGSLTCSLDHNFIKKTKEFYRKYAQKGNSPTDIFSYDFYITSVISLPVPIVTRKATIMTTSRALGPMKQRSKIDIAKK